MNAPNELYYMFSLLNIHYDNSTTLSLRKKLHPDTLKQLFK
jgi:hypothetical protein